MQKFISKISRRLHRLVRENASPIRLAGDPESYWVERKENIIGKTSLEELHRNSRQIETYSAIVHAITSRSPSRVADLGCNFAVVGQLLFENGFSGAYVGIDYNPYALLEAKQALAERRNGWIRANIRSLPLADSSVECVVMKDVLEHMEDFRPLLAEASRVASNYVIIGNFIPWREGETRIRRDPRGYYLNAYNRQEVFSFASQVELRVEEVISTVEKSVGRKKNVGPNEIVVFAKRR